MDYGFTKHAWHHFGKFPKEVQRRVILKIKFYLSQKDPLHFADKLEGGSGKEYRYRIGDYRVIFDWLGNEILVTKVSSRPNAYPRNRR